MLFVIFQALWFFNQMFSNTKCIIKTFEATFLILAYAHHSFIIMNNLLSFIIYLLNAASRTPHHSPTYIYTRSDYKRYVLYKYAV